MFLVVRTVYVQWKVQHQERVLLCASTLGNKVLSDSDLQSSNQQTDSDTDGIKSRGFTKVGNPKVRYNTDFWTRFVMKTDLYSSDLYYTTTIT